MGEIRSAWEIAMDKVKGLGKLSSEELQRRKAEEFISKGKMLADKYLRGLDLWQLEVELSEYDGEDRDLICQSVISSLVKEIKLEGHPDIDRVLVALAFLKGEDRTSEDFKRNLTGLLREYSQMVESRREVVEREERKLMQQLGISGTAIADINPRGGIKGREVGEKVVHPYQERLEELKQSFLNSE